MQLVIESVSLPFKKPFSITGAVYTTCEMIRVILDDEGRLGIGEAVGVDYLGESVESIRAQLESVREDIERGIDHHTIAELLPPGGARNALDCAFWDLRAKREGLRVWELLSTSATPVQTVFTIGIDDPHAMAAGAQEAALLPHLKIKLDAHEPIERLEAIRAARPDATLIVDVNQGWNIAELKEYLPYLKRLDVAMIEQPLARGAEEDLAGLVSPIPLGADESLQHSGEFLDIAKYYDVVNIKLDKCGGLTEAMKIVRLARERGKRLMVGCMVASSYSMAPAFVVAQACEFVDIDGPLLLKADVPGGLAYSAKGVVQAPTSAFWG